MNIAIVGATGNVGRIILEVLEKKNFEVENLYLLASQKSQGSNLKFNGCLLYTSPSPRDRTRARMPSSD